jgi:hypothetical protein
MKIHICYKSPFTKNSKYLFKKVKKGSIKKKETSKNR